MLLVVQCSSNATLAPSVHPSFASSCYTDARLVLAVASGVRHHDSDAPHAARLLRALTSMTYFRPIATYSKMDHINLEGSRPAMRDVLGWRCKFGVLGPSTNTIVQPDFELMRPAGVTNHYSRIFTPNAQAISNETFLAGTQVIGQNTLDAVRSVMTCSPDYLVMGMSAVTFYGGAKGADEFQGKVEKESGVGVSIGSHSCTAAMKAYGGVKRIAVLSPYYPIANGQVARYFTDSGFEVVRDICLQCKSWTAIAEVPPELLRGKLIELNGNGRDVDAIVQVGTNLSMVRLAAAAEMWLGKPVIAINTATYWHALRQNKIVDKIPGLGRLLEEF